MSCVILLRGTGAHVSIRRPEDVSPASHTGSIGRIILTWGMGWAAALVLVGLSFLTVDWREPEAHLPIALAIGAVAFGSPVYRAAAGRTLRSRLFEAAVWTFAFEIASAIVSAHFRGEFFPVPGEVNAITTADVERRNRPALPETPVVLVTTIASFGLLCGTASGLIVRPRLSLSGLGRAMGFGALSALAVCIGVLAILVGLPLLPQLLTRGSSGGSQVVGFATGFAASGLLGGLAAGAIIELAREEILQQPQLQGTEGERDT